ncbi:pentapeptide repeat-containing protein [Streptomyces sp. NPDC058287]|uniref:pentapeptide repeat-containing protein n=1 Tax=Streptomyces sp. NPDC058287 TaxID=3346423 RepID=UPI0036ED3E58
MRRTTRLTARISTDPGASSARPSQTSPSPEEHSAGLDWARRIELFAVLATVAVAVGTLWYSSVQTRQANEQARDDRALAKEGQITDRYTAAVANLGEDKMDVRLGGIYALQRITQDSPRDQSTIANVLATYIRTHATKPPAKGSSVPADVQAAVNILAARDIARDGTFRLDLHAVKLHEVDFVYRRPGSGAAFGSAILWDADLSNTDLHNADLHGANLHHADLHEVKLFDADLQAADLQRADLQAADLQRANLRRADLEGADLRHAILFNADLRHTKLYKADLRRAILAKADLHGTLLAEADLRGAALGGDMRHVVLLGANLRGVGLYKVDLSGADLSRADLSGAYLNSTDLRGAELRGANLRGANLRNADLRGADLRNVKYLTRQQLDSALVDGKTRLPTSL